jgi:hypothetical protein
MDTKPTKTPDPKAQAVPDLRVTPEQATDVKGGTHDALCKGTHIKEVVIE